MMNDYETFIIYYIANIALAQNYKDVYKICATSFDSDNLAFNYNKARFFVLAAESIFVQKSQEGDDSKEGK